MRFAKKIVTSEGKYAKMKQKEERRELQLAILRGRIQNIFSADIRVSV
jgi:hypothetical protein